MVLSHTEKRGRGLRPTGKDVMLMGAGALLYTVVAWLSYLFPLGDMVLRPAAGIVVLSGLVLGPVVGFVVGFLGDMLTAVFQGSVWLHWSIGNGLMGMVAGLLWLWSDIDSRQALTGGDTVKVAVFATAGAFLGSFFAAFVDFLFGTPAGIALGAWGLTAAVANAFFGTIISVLGLYLYKNQGADRLFIRRNLSRVR